MEGAHQSSIDILPGDMIMKILTYLPIKTCISMERVSHRWKNYVFSVMRRRKELNQNDIWSDDELNDGSVSPCFYRRKIIMIIKKYQMANLRSFTIKNICLSRDLFQLLGNKCKRLESFTVGTDDCRHPFNGDDIRKFATECTKLNHFQIGRNDSFDENCFQQMIRNGKNLKNVLLNLCDKRLLGKHIKDSPKSLETLVLLFVEISSDFIPNLCKFNPKLKTLVLWHISDNDFANVCSKMNEIEFFDCYLRVPNDDSNHVFKNVTKLTNLKKLEIYLWNDDDYYYDGDYFERNIDDAFMVNLFTQCEELRYCDLNFTFELKCNDETRNIEAFSIKNCPNIGDGIVPFLCNMPELTTLILKNTGVTDAVCSAIESCNKLNRIDLSQSNGIGNETRQCISKCFLERPMVKVKL